ncbi:MAG TPA: hypothetical protein VGH99_16170 [Pseudonocardia sp.]|jgi:hypothetical protein
MIAVRETRGRKMPDLSAVGRAGVLTVATRGTEGAGEVQVSLRGATETLLAWSAEPLARGTHVVVVGVVSSRTVRVVRADEVGLG